MTDFVDKDLLNLIDFAGRIASVRNTSLRLSYSEDKGWRGVFGSRKAALSKSGYETMEGLLSSMILDPDGFDAKAMAEARLRSEQHKADARAAVIAQDNKERLASLAETQYIHFGTFAGNNLAWFEKNKPWYLKWVHENVDLDKMEKYDKVTMQVSTYLNIKFNN